MAIKKTGDNQAKATQPTERLSQQPHQEKRVEPKHNAGLGSVYTRIQRSMKRNQIGEITSKFTEVVDETISQASGNLKYRVLPVDGTTHSMHYSVLTLVAEGAIGGKTVGAMYTLILEGSNNRPAPAIETIGRINNVEIPITAMDAWDVNTFNKTLEVVVLAIGHDNVLNAGACVVPSDIDVLDKARINEIVWNANEALYSAFETSYPEAFDHLNITDYIDQTERVALNTEFNNGNVENVVGLPQRSDIHMRVSVSDIGETGNVYTDWNHNSNRELLEVCGFVNAVFTGIAPQQPGQPVITQTMLPQIVLTKIGAIDMPQTPETYLLGLSLAALLGDEYQWAQQFMGWGQAGIHDIGGVGLRLPVETPQVIDTASNTFGEKEMYDLVATVFQPNPVFSLDCEDTGPDSWLTGIFVEAANGNPAATQYIVDAANRLTNGNFSSYWGGGAVVETTGTRVHVGTYRDAASGELRDLRDMDSLAMLNLLGHTDMEAVEAFEDTFNNLGLPVELRLAQRLDILRQQLGSSNVNVRGMAERLVITSEFLNALVSACGDAGLLVDQNGLRPIYGNKQQTGNTYLAQYSVHGNAGGLVRQRHAGRNLGGRRPYTGMSHR